MSSHKVLKQGDIIMVSFDPVLGSEEGKRRPAVVVSNNDYNSFTPMKKLVPITSTISGFPMHILLPDNLVVHGELLTEQETCKDLSARPFRVIGHLPDEILDDLLALLQDSY